MDIRGLANSAVQSVNADVLVTVYRSTGYTIGAGSRQVPAFDAGTVGYAQVQSISSKSLQHLDGINQQGIYSEIYLRGVLNGIVRPDGKGGDKIVIDGKTWLVINVAENWPSWSRVIVCLQQ